MYYIKLKDNFLTTDKITYREETKFYGVREPGNTHVGFRYNHIDVENSENYFSVVPERFRSDFTLLSLHIILNRAKAPPPHIDAGVLCCINFYVRADTIKTQFYSRKQSSTAIPWNNIVGLTFNLDDLIEAGAFNAADGDVYLLDTSTPHSVTALNGSADRLVLSLQTHTLRFAEVKEMLQETNSI